MVNISPWKAQAVRRMFQKPARSKEIFFLRSAGAIAGAKASARPVISWASKIDRRLERKCDKAGVELQRLEDGFIRSVGLGTNFHPPMSLIHDTRGIYYDANRPSDLEVMLSETEFTPELTERARDLMSVLIENGISKYNTAEVPLETALPSGVKTIFVPGQVESDASLRHGDCHAANNTELLRKVRESEPDAFIIYKPHPDVVSGQRKGLQDRDVIRAYADLHVEKADPLSIVTQVDEVHTLTSLTGFEALIRGKKVHCYGMPFYGGWGLTVDAAPCPRRTRKLTVEQLVAGRADPLPALLRSPERPALRPGDRGPADHGRPRQPGRLTAPDCGTRTERPHQAPVPALSARRPAGLVPLQSVISQCRIGSAGAQKKTPRERGVSNSAEPP